MSDKDQQVTVGQPIAPSHVVLTQPSSETQSLVHNNDQNFLNRWGVMDTRIAIINPGWDGEVQNAPHLSTPPQDAVLGEWSSGSRGKILILDFNHHTSLFHLPPGICDCFENFYPSCLCVSFCPCVIRGQMAEDIEWMR